MKLVFSRFASALSPSPPEIWTLAETILTTPHGKKIDLKTVTRAALDDFHRKDNWSTKLTLKAPGRSVTIRCTDWIDGDSRRQCFVLIQAILSSLNRCNPNLNIRWGNSQLTRLLQSAATLPLLGFATAMLCVFMLGATHVQALGGESLSKEEIVRWAIAMLPPLGMILFVFWIIWRLSPWHTSRKLTPVEMRSLIQNQPGMTGL